MQFVDTATNKIVSRQPVGRESDGADAGGRCSSALARPIAAVYGGDANFTGSTSAALPAIVNAANSLSASFAADEIGSIFSVPGLNGNTSATLPPESP